MTDGLFQQVWKEHLNTSLQSPTVHFNVMHSYPKQEVVKEMTEQILTVSPAGLAEVVTDLISLLPTTRVVDKMAEATGRYYNVEETIPAEELFTLVGIRVGDDGKFVIQLSEHDLDKMNRNKVRSTAVEGYEAL